VLLLQFLTPSQAGDDTSSSGRDAESNYNYNSEHHEDPSRNQASEGNGGSNNACLNGVCYSAMAAPTRATTA